MPSISSCPTCHRDLTIPDMADGMQELRCPLCDAQFSAQRVLADCVGFPPLAIVVEAAKPHDEIAGTEGPQYSPVGEMPEPAAEHSARDLTEPQPLTGAAEGVAETDDVASRAPSAESRPGGEADETEAAAGDRAFEPQVAGLRVAPRTRRQASPFAMLGQLLGMALGGVLGLAIGYWVLLWLGGPQADFLEIRGKLPRWIRPPVRRHDAAPLVPLANEATEQEPAGEAQREPVDSEPWPSPIGAAAMQLFVADDENSMSLQSVPAEPGVEEQAPLEKVASEPDVLAATENRLPEGYLGPRGFKPRTAAELKATIEQSELALRCPRCQVGAAVRLASFESAPDSPAEKAASAPLCNVCRGKPVPHLGTSGFTQLCELGELVTFVQFGRDDAEREPLREAAENVLIAVGSQRDKRETIGRLAGAWLEESGRQTNGIVLAGTVEEAIPQGDLFVVRIMLLSCGKHVEVVSRQSPQPPLSRRDQVVILGSIVESPAENLVGYEGDASQVIWGGLHFKVAQ
jgi:uncharacterized C2H2 Zn-finger protein